MNKDYDYEVLEDKEEIDSLKGVVHLLIVTTTPVEFSAVIKSASPFPHKDQILKYQNNSLTYYLGVLGKFPVAIIHSAMMGSLNRDASAFSVKESISEWDFKAVFLVGIAFGIDKDKQQIGDILVAKQLSQYETAKVSSFNTTDTVVITRGYSVPPSASLLNIFNQRNNYTNSSTHQKYKIHSGEILCGEKVVNNQNFRDQLISRFPSAIGGEMEGNGVYNACSQKKIDWIVIKSICDWGDEYKDDKWQEIAASNSIGYVKEILNVSSVLSDLKIFAIDSDEAKTLLNIKPISYSDMKSLDIVKLMFPRHNVTSPIKISEPNLRINYEYVVATITDSVTVGHLFLSRNINQKATIDHALQNISSCSTLAVITPREQRKGNTSKFVNRIKNIQDKFEENPKHNNFPEIQYHYLEDIVWSKCLGNEVHKLNNDIHREKYFLDQHITYVTNEGIENTEFSLKYFKEALDGSRKEKPIIAVIGSAGVGKTTLCDQLVNLIDSIDGKKILYISSMDIYIDNEGSDISTISDLYRVAYKDSDSSNNLLLDKNNLEINISCGNIVVVIDGLDEIEARFKGRFRRDEFMNNVLSLNECYNNSLFIITSRDYYRNLYDNVNYIQLMELKGFNKALVDRYFEKRLSPNSLKFANKQLEDLVYTEKNLYPPLLLSLVCDIVESEDKCTKCDGKERDNELSVYLDNNQTIDNLVIKFFDREIKRQSLNMSVDNIVDIFMEISVLYGGEIKKRELELYLEMYCQGISRDVASGFYLNPFFKTSYTNDTVQLRHDTLLLLFKARYFEYSVRNNIINMTFLSKLLIEFYDGKSELLNEVVKHTMIDDESLLAVSKIVIGKLRDIYKEYFTSRDRKITLDTQKYISAWFYFIFRMRPDYTRTERSEFISMVYSGDIQYFFIYGDFFPLDFSIIKISDSGFERYQEFESSIFPEEKTVFYKTYFKEMNPKNKIGADNIVFDNSCEISTNLKKAILKSEVNRKQIIESIKKDFELLFGIVYHNRAFLKKSENIFKIEKRKLNGNIPLEEYIKFLFRSGVFDREETRSGDSQFHYFIAADFKDDIRYFMTNAIMNPKLTKVFKEFIEKKIPV